MNYEGVIDYYEITYPNYFYWVVCIEFLILGGFLAWNYRKKSFQNNKLMQEKKEFSQKIIIAELNAKEKERKQITRNLHDELGATLSALNLVITNNYSDDKYLANTIEKANTDLRYFYSQLSEDVTQGDGVFAFIKLKEEEINQSLPIKFTSFLDGDDATLPSDMVFNLKKIIAELINNSLKHAKCTEITIQLIIENQQLQLIFEDNGVGYNSLKQHEGMGLNNIYHRVDSLNGDIHVSSDKKGTTTIITFIFKLANMKKISIVLVDDHQLFLEGMERILESENEFSVINNFQSSEKLMVTNFVSPPDLFVLDVEIPVINGIALCQYIKEKYPSSKVLFVSMYVNNQFVRAAKEADADGFISKNSSLSVCKTKYS